MTREELQTILDKHKKWVFDEAGGERADLRGAYLREADLRGADLREADLRGAKIEDQTLNKIFPISCPDSGAFVGWKKCSYNRIVKLIIPEDAKRCSAFGRKCRCDKAVVLDIQDRDGNSIDGPAISKHDSAFLYVKGQEVSVPDFDDDRRNECSTGIHFFITRQEAVNY